MKINKETVEKWRQMASDWLDAATTLGTEHIRKGREAWSVAHQSGICNEAYADPSIVDAHIQTALEQIFPNAVFLDRKVY